MSISKDKCCTWSDLHDDILELISKRLSLGDSIRGTAVCKSWRLLSEKKQQLPLLLSYSRLNMGINSFFSLFGSRTRRPKMILEYQGKCPCGFAYGWWIFSYNGGDISLFNPNGSQEIQLPKRPTTRHGSCSFVEKAILSCAPTPGNDCIVTAIINDYPFGSILAFCRPRDEAWIPFNFGDFGDTNSRGFGDVVYFKGNIYAIHHSSGRVKIFVFDIGDSYPPKAKDLNLEGFPPWTISERTFYLVECRGELLLVIRRSLNMPRDKYFAEESYKIEVFRHAFGCRSTQLVRVESLGDGALFLGSRLPFSLSSARLFEGKGNCIYYITLTGDLGVFDLSNEEHSYFPTDYDCRFFSHVWVTTDPW